jgi:hypothetical protein
LKTRRRTALIPVWLWLLLAARAAPAQTLTLPMTVAPGGSLTVSWSGLKSPTAKDWIGLYLPGSPNQAFADWAYTNGQADGTIIFPVGKERQPGLYELRLFRNDGFTLAATGPAVVVTGTAPLPPPPPPPPPLSLYGPRDPVGPDVPLTALETAAFAPRVAVLGRTAAAINQAIATARAQSIPTVFLPQGTYMIEAFVKIPAGMTLYGEGSSTLLKAATIGTEMLFSDGDNVRVTRLRLEGWSLVWTDANAGGSYNATRGVENWGHQGLRVDHCDLAGFNYGVAFLFGGSGTIDHCRITRNQVVGLGYGVALDAGSKVTVSDCELGDNRHSISANGAGAHLEALYNHFVNRAPSINQRAAIDTHAGFTGDFLILGNQFDAHPSMPVGLTSGSGIIKNNRFSGNTGITLYPSTNNGVTGFLHDIAISGNAFENTTIRYSVLGGPWPKITVDGTPYVPAAPGRGAPRRKR